MSDEGRLVAGRYRLMHRIGTGAMGIVWQAHDERLNRTVAIKQVLLQPGLSQEETEEALERCRREGRIAAKLHHPNAVTVFDVVDEDDAPWLVMEFVPNQSMAAAMKERGQLPPLEVAAIGAQIAAALAAAHAAGIVHRDVKPGNILLAENGAVKITDFGISRASDDVTVTKTGLIAGTPAYLAPEVAYGKEPTPPTDIFSLGSTLYAAVEGEPPFGLSENTLGLLHAVAAGRINPPRHAGPLAPVLIALLATEAEDRPTATQARDMLAAVARGDYPDVPENRTLFAGPHTNPRTQGIRPASSRSRTGVRPAAAPPRPPAKNSKRPFIVAGAALALVIGIGAALVAARSSDAENSPSSNVNSTQTTVSSTPSATTTTTTTEPTSTTTKAPPKTTKTTTTTTETTTTTKTSTTPKPTTSSSSSTSTTPPTVPPTKTP